MGAYGFETPKPLTRPVSKPKYTKSQLFAMNRKEQVKILKSLGVTRIPRREIDRVNKILELM